MRIFAAALFCALPLVAADLNGVWEFSVSAHEFSAAQRVNLAQENGQYTFTMSGSKLTGSRDGDSIRFDCTEGQRKCGVLRGTVIGNSISGGGEIEGIPASWSMRRPLPRPATARRYEFTPRTFYRQFAAAKDPALHIFPGDTVHTWTVDAGGYDANGKHLVFGGNPLTGPFYIEGAMPGDSLTVKFVRVRLNRDTARSGEGVVASALNPYYFRDQPKVDKFDSEWKLDRENGVAILKNPTAKLKNYKIPLRPMIGCIGVAPPGNEAMRAGRLGSWGGNLDYNQIGEGTTVYLSVNVPGALLFVGDGHAAQGDGELTGDALETSMDVEFTVDLQQGRHAGVPRFENAEYVMMSGVGNSLHDALQTATTSMSEYLARQYKLNPAEVAMVLGTALKYDIAEVVDPSVHVVAKLPRTALAGLQ